MRILDRYLIRYFLIPFFYCILVFIFLFIVIDFFGRLDEVLRYNISNAILIEYYISMLPFIFLQGAPFGSLIAIIYVINNMNRHGELTAMTSVGIKRFRIVLPFIYIGLIISILNFIISEGILPSAMKRAGFLKENYMEKFETRKNGGQPKKIEYNIALYGKNNNLIFIDIFDVYKKICYGITILHEDKKENIFSKISAQEAHWKNGYWLFLNLLVYKLNGKGDIISVPEFFENKAIEMEKPKELLTKGSGYEFMSLRELEGYIKNFSSLSPKIIKRLEVDLHHKASFPFISLIMILIGTGFGMHIKQKKPSLTLIGISILIGFFYYGVMAICVALGKSGALAPFISAHLANLIFGTIGMALIFRD